MYVLLDLLDFVEGGEGADGWMGWDMCVFLVKRLSVKSCSALSNWDWIPAFCSRSIDR